MVKVDRKKCILYLNKEKNCLVLTEKGCSYYWGLAAIHSIDLQLTGGHDKHDIEYYWDPIPLSDLPLYISWPYKSDTFMGLLTGKFTSECPW